MYRWVATLLTLVGSLTLGVNSASGDVVSEVDLKYRDSLDHAVERGLAYLAAQQAPDGTFGQRHRITVAALGVMAFLAKGYTPGLGPYGENINRGVDAVLDTQLESGQVAKDGRMYGHNIATLMLSQVSGMVDPERQKRIDKALGKALKLTLDAQRVSKPAPDRGGWRYEPNSTDSDMSLTGWAFMALRSARNAGCAVPNEAVEQAVQYIIRCNKSHGFGYRPGSGPSLPLTGSGVLCLELSGRHRDKITLEAGKLIQGRPIGQGRFWYCSYYCAQAMFQLGGEEWEEYAPKLYDKVLSRQKPDGSFQPDQDSGPWYATAMAVLSLTPSYRQLPIYQR